MVQGRHPQKAHSDYSTTTVLHISGAVSSEGGLPLFGVVCLIVGILVVAALVFVTVSGVIIYKRHRMRVQMRRVFDVDVRQFL